MLHFANYMYSFSIKKNAFDSKRCYNITSKKSVKGTAKNQ